MWGKTLILVIGNSLPVLYAACINLQIHMKVEHGTRHRLALPYALQLRIDGLLK